MANHFMDLKNSRAVTIALAFALFGLIDLLMLLVTPETDRMYALLPPTISLVVVLVSLPRLIELFEWQQNRIEHQRRAIATLHAMDTAVTAELELPSVLDVAVRQATRAADANLGGLYLCAHGDEPEVLVLSAAIPAEQQEAFRAFVRDGAFRPGLRDAIRVPLRRGDEAQGFLAVANPARAGGRFDPQDRDLLTDLAATVVVAIGNARSLEAARHLVLVEQQLARERRVAHALQEGLLPEVPERSGAYVFSKLYQAQSSEALVGGDIYDLFALRAGVWGLVIADVSGKGLAAAQKTAMVKYALRSYAREHGSPAEVLTRLNAALFDEPDLTGFVTVIYGVLTEGDGRFVYASAGHETPILLRDDGAYETLSPTGLILGAIEGAEYGEAAAVLSPGDGLLLFTDGFSEARSPDGEFLDIAGLADLLREVRRDAPDSVAPALLERVRVFAEGRLSDDAAAIWVQRRSGGAVSSDR